jgi:uncharacterized membrane protein YcjF (UPF0283 family)
MAREWTNQDLVDYISRFKDVQREYVLKQLLESDILAKFLGTTEGRLILNNVVDSITAETMNIVRLSTVGQLQDTAEIMQSGRKINAAYNFMYSIAKIAEDGQIHTEKMKKK